MIWHLCASCNLAPLFQPPSLLVPMNGSTCNLVERNLRTHPPFTQPHLTPPTSSNDPQYQPPPFQHAWGVISEVWAGIGLICSLFDDMEYFLRMCVCCCPSGDIARTQCQALPCRITQSWRKVAVVNIWFAAPRMTTYGAMLVVRFISCSHYIVFRLKQFLRDPQPLRTDGRAITKVSPRRDAALERVSFGCESVSDTTCLAYHRVCAFYESTHTS